MLFLPVSLHHFFVLFAFSLLIFTCKECFDTFQNSSFIFIFSWIVFLGLSCQKVLNTFDEPFFLLSALILWLFSGLFIEEILNAFIFLFVLFWHRQRLLLFRRLDIFDTVLLFILAENRGEVFFPDGLVFLLNPFFLSLSIGFNFSFCFESEHLSIFFAQLWSRALSSFFWLNFIFL
jgi:hypothetical protein